MFFSNAGGDGGVSFQDHGVWICVFVRGDVGSWNYKKMLGEGSCWKSSRMFNHFWSFQKVTCFFLQNHPAQMKGEPC